MKKLIQTCILFLGFCTIANAQININLILRRPTPSDLSEWQTDPSIVQLVITNTSQASFPNAYFSVRIINEKGVEIVKTSGVNRFTPRVNIPSGPTTVVFTGHQILHVNTLIYDRSIGNIALTTNSIPEGNYQICISVFEQTGKNITSVNEFCTSFFIMMPDPPVLISPVDDDLITNAFPNFFWTPVTNISPASFVNYKIKICPVFEGQTPRTAIDRNPVLFERSNILNSSYQYLPSDLPFDFYNAAVRYVWMVQAFDQQGRPVARNQGRSEIGTFRVRRQGTSATALSNEYPANNDTIPWDNPHLVARFSPYSDNIRSARITVRVRKDGTSDEFSTIRTVNFPTGPQSSQGLTSQELAGMLIVNLNESRGFPEWMNNLEHGPKYNWNAEVVFTMNDGSTENAVSGTTSFVKGFKKPVITLPENEASVKAGEKINVSFQIPRPTLLNIPHHEILNNQRFHGYNAFAVAGGKFAIEFSKNPSFDPIYRTHTTPLPAEGTYRSGNDCNTLFDAISKELDAIADTGLYYWRVNYLNASDIKYYTSPHRILRITPATFVSCFELKVLSPAHKGTWTTNKNPRFTVSVSPQIRKSAITGGKMKIWKMNSATENIAEVKGRDPVIDKSFTGNDNSKIYAYSTDLDGYTRYDLNFINGDSESETFTADTDATYLWHFDLQFKKDSIRVDGTLCDSTFVRSNEGIFTVSSATAGTNPCPGECYTAEPTNKTPGTQTFAADSVLKIGQFELKLITVSGTGSSLTGEGSIDVPYFRGDILVEFNSIKVNSSNEVYEGEVFGKIAADAPYAKPEANDFEGKALAFAHEKAKFKNIHEYSSSAGRLVSGLIGSAPVALPIGFDHDYDGNKVVAGIIGMKFTPTHAVLNAAAYVELPELGPDVGFGLGAKNICFHKDGYSGDGRIILYLAQDFGYRNEDSWSFLFKAPTPTVPGTQMILECKEFKEFAIVAEVEFPRTWLKPDPDDDPAKLVKARFNAFAEKNGNGWQWLAVANLDKSEFTGANGFKMQVQEMIFDYSTAKNPEGIVFPANYTGNTTNNWKGFYIKQASITLPEVLKSFENVSPVVSVRNLIIDKVGFTANIRAENVFQYPLVNFGDWGGSIDTLNLNIVGSSFASGNLKGRIKVSVIDSSLVYTALISRPSDGGNLKYQLTVNPDTVNADIWKAKLALDKTSKIELTYTTGEFAAEAVLTGKLSIVGGVGILSKVGFDGLTFENFKVMSKSPYFEKGNWGFASPQHSMAGFPVSINNLNIVTGTSDGSIAAGLQFNLNVGLQSGSNAISGSTKLSIWGKMASGGGPQRFVFDRVSLDSLGINAELPTVKIQGNLNLYNDHNVFGTGFRGAVTAMFIDQIAVQATAQFGSVNNYRYWYVDAKMLNPAGIPIFTGVGIYGFGGGAWHHMRRSGSTALDLSATPPAADKGLTPGTSNSGYSYVPDKGVNGFMAMVVMGTHPSPEAFNCDLSLNTQFLSDGGIGTISLTGQGYMLSSITNRSNAKITANADVEYNFPLKTFHGVFDVNINATPFTGGGDMVLHFAPDLWYVKIGEPGYPINVGLANWLEGPEGYLMIGQNLPSPPPLPTQIQTLFPDLTITRSPAVDIGNGFAFGAATGFNTGRQKYLAFYGQIAAEVGFDMALLNYGQGTTCEGMTGPMGLNGWYASGQIYAALAASIGIGVDLTFVKGNFEILSLNAGAVLTGGAPNPTWVQGAVGGNYRILGGRINGHCNFQFQMGEVCQPMIESPLSRMDLIADVNPINNRTNVDVFTEPQVALNFEVDTPFELEEMLAGSDNSRIRTFRVRLNQLNLIKTAGNDTVPGRRIVGQNKQLVYYSPHEMLEGNTRYRFGASAFGEEWISGNWIPAKRNNGTVITQNESVTFTTGNTPNHIPPSNVAFTYPVNSQRYFLQDECRTGQVQLKTGQSSLFQPGPGTLNTQLFARFIPLDINVQPVEVPFTYNQDSKSLLFEIPVLQNNRAYFVQIIKKELAFVGFTPSGSMPTTGNNQQTLSIGQMQALNQAGSSVFINQSRITETRVRSGEKLLYTFYFGTSRFNTLQAKLNSFVYTSTQSSVSQGMYETVKARYQGVEYFDHFDFNPVRWTVSGNNFSFGPLIKLNAFERTAAWHNNFANPRVYDQIEWLRSKGWWQGHVEFERYFTNPQLNFVGMEYNTYRPSLNEMAQLAAPASNQGGSTTNATGGFSPSQFGGAGATLGGLQPSFQIPPVPFITLQYNHGIIVPSDYSTMRTRAASVLSNASISKTSADRTRLNNIINSTYQLMLRGNYPVRYFYNHRCNQGIDFHMPTISKPFVY
jgi:hypothetical protein